MIQPLSKLHSHLDISVNKMTQYNHTHVIILERENNNVIFYLNSLILELEDRAYSFRIFNF